ncbi:hypothetical protein AX16_004874 [Volvariella volvacea WC 439]|nr:hypothetical protein AX16_004874 [Volvariella volvacea WC 439]
MSSLRLPFRALAFSTTLFLSAQSALYTDPSQLPNSTYDYIVVGAGTAGNVIAARLTENSNCQVLVLEAGPSDAGILASTVPLLAPSLMQSQYDWNYTIEPQKHLNGRTMALPRGRLLGGTSSMNYMLYTRGAAEDFDKYAEITGDPGWRWDNMEEYRLRNERLVSPADGRDMTGMYDPAVHGTSGALPVSMPGMPLPLDKKLVNVLDELRDEFPFNQDMNGESGQRVSSATAFLHPNIDRPNLHVLVNAQVTKLIKTGSKGGRPVFGAVEFQSDPTAAHVRVNANSEIILSAGAIGSPVILQLSGIGDKKELDLVGIDTIVDLPSVGKNLSDHVGSVAIFRVNEPSYDGLFRQPAAFQEAMVQWQTQRTGPFSNSPINQRFLTLHLDLMHYEILFFNLFYFPGVPLPEGNFMTVGLALISPASRGTVKLASRDPWVAPLIDPNFLSREFDRAVIREGFKSIYKITNASAWGDFIQGPWEGSTVSADNDKVDEYFRSISSSVFHPVGSAAMSPKAANWGVLDPDLRVKGVEGVRVVDASIMPFISSGHTQAPVYILAERAADIIKASPEFKRTVEIRDEL